MSPASSGSLEVERYIGACLISSHNRTKTTVLKQLPARERLYHREHFTPELYNNSYAHVNNRYSIQRCNSIEGWAGGMPLISFTNQRRGRNNENSQSSSPRIEDHQSSPLARLAVHTQGAPLILSRQFNHKKNKSFKNGHPQKNGGKPTNGKESTNVISADAVSVTSDESSGSANSENCLPRIIKPRKRRKKDRKPLHLNHPGSHDGFSTDSASPDADSSAGVSTLNSYIPFAYNFNFISANRNGWNEKQYLNESSETPKLHHSFEDIEEVDDTKDLNGNQSTTTCQCRYCDPAGVIWNVDRNCYSPFLTTPVHKKSDIYSQPGTPPVNSSPSHFCLIHGMSSISLNERGRKDSLCEQTVSGDLQVSTEIITSPNGHRDLEIKFFSTPPPENVRLKCCLPCEDESDQVQTKADSSISPPDE